MKMKIHTYGFLRSRMYNSSVFKEPVNEKNVTINLNYRFMYCTFHDQINCKFGMISAGKRELKYD